MQPAIKFLTDQWRTQNLKASSKSALILEAFLKLSSPTPEQKEDRKDALAVLSRTVLFNEFFTRPEATLADFFQMTVDRNTTGLGDAACVAITGLHNAYPDQDFVVGGFGLMTDSYVMAHLSRPETPVFHGSGKKVTEKQARELESVSGRDLMALIPSEFTAIFVPPSVSSYAPCVVALCSVPQIRFSDEVVDMTTITVVLKAKSGVNVASYSYVSDDKKPFNMSELDPTGSIANDPTMVMGQKRMFGLVAYALRTIKELYQ